MAKTRPYRAIQALFFLSGAAGLVYEVAWARILALTFGNTVLATSTVVGAFLGGLGIGGLLGGRLSKGVRNGVRAFALLEISVGALSFFTPRLFYGAGDVQRQMASWVGFETPLFALLRFLFIFLILLLPTTLMGAGLPILCRHLIRSRAGIGRRVGRLYAANTLGAAAGAFACGFVLIETLGNAGAVHTAAGLDVLIGLAAWRWRGAPVPGPAAAEPRRAAPRAARPAKRPGSARERGGHARGEARRRAASPAIPLGWVYGITAISGFVSMALQIVWIRAFRHFISNSTYAFSLILVIYLLGIGAGSLAAGRWLPRVKRPFLLFGLLEAALGVLSLLSLPILTRLFYVDGVHAFLFSGTGISFAGRALHYGLAVLLVLLPPTLVMGFLFPLAAALCTRAVAGVGRFVGNLYFINTIGSITGALAAGFLLLTLFGINGSILFVSTLIAACGLAVILRAPGVRAVERARASLALAMVFALLYLTVPRPFAYRGVLEDPQRSILYYDEGVMSTVKVFESRAGGIRTLSVDGNSIGSAPYTYADMKQRLMAHLPMLVGPGGREILNIGLGTGITAGCFTLYPEAERIRAVEIVPGVIEGARLFGKDNRGLFSNRAVDIRASDGMTWLQVVDDAYDVIASDGKLNPLYSGNSIVLCREFYALCRDRLRPGGRFAQWINASIPTREFLIVLKTISDVFPEVDVFFYPPANVFFLAGKEPLRIDSDRLFARMRDTPGVAGDLAMYQIDVPEALEGGYIGNARGFAPLVHDLPVNSWNRTVIEFETPRIWFDRPKERNVAETLGLFLRCGDAPRRGSRLTRIVKGFDRMDEADRAAILRAAAINRLYIEALISYLTSGNRARFRDLLRRILEIDPENRRAKAWLREPRRFITF